MVRGEVCEDAVWQGEDCEKATREDVRVKCKLLVGKEIMLELIWRQVQW